MAWNRDAKNRGGGATVSSRQRNRERIQLRLLRIKDVPQIILIERLCFPLPWSRETFESLLLDKNFQTMGAFSSTDTLLAYVVYFSVLDELHILNVAVSPPHRRKGFAKILLARVHLEAKRSGCNIAYLEVRASNAAARELYSKFGYSVLGQRKEYYSDNNEDAVLMTKVFR